MVTSIKLKGKYNIGVNSSNQINAFDTNVSLKDIPFIRYDFGTYSAEDTEYIRNCVEKFKLSTHLIQYMVSPNIMSDLENTKEFLGRMAKYLYFVIEQNDMLNGSLKQADLVLAQQALSVTKFDRIMIIDKTQSMDMANAKKIMADTAKLLGIKIDDIGICDSPLCLNEQLACLTALKARELATIYNQSIEVALPTANHQCMNCCGCMRFFEVTSDIEAPADNKVKKTTTKKNNETTTNEDKPKAPKKAKVTPQFNYSSFI